MNQLSEGMPAPPFTLAASTGGTICLADYAGKKTVVLYFYPKDMTPGCTMEACGFRDLAAAFNELGAVILGVSGDCLESHHAFAAAERLNFPLLSDTDASVSTAYGVYREKQRQGRRYMGIDRTTFVIDKAGIVSRIFPKVSVEGHAQEVLEAVREVGDR
ncbi:thioredoxin-dependent thiol peroxidase [bacterium]|nr:thioredoxin-dependent thiol peroxidase [bacterium]